MPKKSKRQARKTPAAIVPVAAATVPVQTAVPTRLTTAVEFNPDYTNVRKDLRRIGILVVSFTVVLVVLSFFI